MYLVYENKIHSFKFIHSVIKFNGCFQYKIKWNKEFQRKQIFPFYLIPRKRMNEINTPN